MQDRLRSASMAKKSKIFITIALSAILIISFFVFLLPNLLDRDRFEPPPYQKILLNRFPISLDVLFWNTSPADQATYLDGMKTWQTELGVLFLTPYPNYFHAYHTPATFKWYFSIANYTTISFPVDTFMRIRSDNANATSVINGTDVRMDLAIDFIASYYITFHIGHVCLNLSLFEAWESAAEIEFFSLKEKAVFIKANTTFGFSMEYGTEFRVLDKMHFNYNTTSELGITLHAANPFLYFTEDVQNELISRYQPQLNAMRESGLYVESSLNRSYDINEGGTLFGTWFYKEGSFVLNESHHKYGWYAFDGCIINMLNVNKTDRDTFYKDKNLVANFTSDMIGVFYDSDYANVDDYELIGGKYMYFMEGNLSQGILNLTDFFANERPGPIFLKYQVIPCESNMYCDLLLVDYFSTLVGAQGDFTPDTITYQRIYETHP
jgi:hypothetical protein